MAKRKKKETVLTRIGLTNLPLAAKRLIISLGISSKCTCIDAQDGFERRANKHSLARYWLDLGWSL